MRSGAYLSDLVQSVRSSNRPVSPELSSRKKHAERKIDASRRFKPLRGWANIPLNLCQCQDHLPPAKKNPTSPALPYYPFLSVREMITFKGKAGCWPLPARCCWSDYTQGNQHETDIHLQTRRFALMVPKSPGAEKQQQTQRKKKSITISLTGQQIQIWSNLELHIETRRVHPAGQQDLKIQVRRAVNSSGVNL